MSSVRPRSRMAASCAPRAIAHTSWPADANSTAMSPPIAPAPKMQNLIGGRRCERGERWVSLEVPGVAQEFPAVAGLAPEFRRPKVDQFGKTQRLEASRRYADRFPVLRRHRLSPRQPRLVTWISLGKSSHELALIRQKTHAAHASAASIRVLRRCVAALHAKRSNDLPPGRTKAAARWNSGQRGVFARSAATFDAGLDLKIGQQVVREGDELLPGAVRRVGHRRHRMEGQTALELRDGLLVIAAAGHEIPQVGQRVVQIAGDRRVLIVPIIGIEQIELEVLRRLMRNLPAINRY